MDEEIRPFQFNNCVITALRVEEETFRGDELRGVELPTETFPMWKIIFDQGDGEQVMLTNSPVSIVGRMLTPIDTSDEEIPSEDE
jgi:hypothetical protein